MKSGGLLFDIDYDEIAQLGVELEASKNHIRYALTHALRRTATTLRTMTARALRDELQLRTLTLIRNRLKSMKLREQRGEGFELWVGLNDMPASWFKGTPKKVPGGAQVRGTAIDGGFIAKSKFKGRRTVFKRYGAKRLPIVEQSLPVEDRATVLIEDTIFTQVEEIFWKNFRRDLAARVRYQVGWQ